MRTALTIGREPDNDLVINLPIVSGHHARLTWLGTPGEGTLEDLGSSNGTAIGQFDRKITRATITAGQTVYFGNHAVPAADLLAWVDPSLAPPLVLRGGELVVGRDASCHRVIDRVTISGRHARLRKSGDRFLIEDLGSSNGTFVNGERVEGPTVIRAGDLIGLGAESFRFAPGSAPVSGTVRMEALPPGPTPAPSPTLRAGVSPPQAVARVASTIQMEVSPAKAHASAPAQSPTHPIALAALLAQAPVLALLLGALSTGPASALFNLSLAAVWFGLSTAVFGLLLDPKRPRAAFAPEDSAFWLARLGLLAGLCLGECLMAQLVVFAMKGLGAPAFFAFGLLVLASWVGLAAGGLIAILSPRPTIAFGGPAVALVGLALFGGGPWSLPRSASVVRLASNVAPSRWAFEGLLLAESDAKAPLEPVARDLAEDYFPAATDRMGPTADTTALGAMLIGLLGLAAFLVRFAPGDRETA